MVEKEKLNKSDFDKDRLYDYVKKFSFPRLAGTEGEPKAVKMAEDTFKEIGFNDNQIEKEPFEFSDFYSTSLIQIIMLISFNFILILFLFIYIYFLVTLFVVAGMAVFVLLLMRGLKHPEEIGFFGEYFGDTHSATNVIVKIPASKLKEEKAGNIVISAHLDSKSQTFKTSWRIVTYRVWLFSGILLGGFYLALMIEWLGVITLNHIITGYSILVLTILIMISNLFLMFLNTDNKSPGALDNASGMAIVFELSSYFKDNPLENYNIWCCQFSAEELGTMGSRIFVNNREEKFEKGKIFQINLDMVSSAQHSDSKNRVEYLKSYGVLPRKKIAPILSKYLDNAAREEDIRIYGFHLSTGAHLDSVPFHLRGYSAVDISTRAAAAWTHNEVDTPDKVDPKILLEATIIVRKTMIMLDKDFNTLKN